LTTRPPPISTLFPYTTLFRSSFVEATVIDCPRTFVRVAPVASVAAVIGKSNNRSIRNSVVQLKKYAESGASIRNRVAATLRLPRSEEHTSELQSLTNLVCRLL